MLFSVPADHVEATARRDWSVAEERIIFGDRIGGLDMRHCLGNRSGPLQTLNIPRTASFVWQGDAMAILLRESWTVDRETYATDTVLGLRLQDVLVSKPRPVVLRCGSDRSGVEQLLFVKEHVLLCLLDDLRPRFLMFYPDGPGGWLEVSLSVVPDNGVVSIEPLDAFEHESDGSLLITAQDPVTPPTLMLTCVSERAPPSGVGPRLHAACDHPGGGIHQAKRA